MIRQCGPEEDRWEAPMELKQREMMKRNDESEKSETLYSFLLTGYPVWISGFSVWISGFFSVSGFSVWISGFNFRFF